MTNKEKTIESLDKHWHLAKTDAQIELTELEYAIYRVYAAFDRWQIECVAASAQKPLNSTESVVLHVIRMRDRPKTITEVARLLNRDDIPNLQYAIRKLTSAGLIEKVNGKGKKTICYRATEQGKEVTDKYSQLREEQLLPLLDNVHNWQETVATTRRMLDLLNGIYDSAALNISTHRPHIEE